ncbi:ABC transporter ATP-binding protein [Enterococcus sp. BWR-S5]|uniref:ABC transporter ATP-binding protein n=1 Tax=Enterococcus sp. BWR-S5 TaxID=2787714 RepID=UPI0019223039|nr:ABC transporter ATP-binding protein [Enterococcus sp. BWR-S5]MBL1227306.1 ABC transporter ATP-binding protein [Enterococcus sp. BWR-S5]
MEKLIIGKGIIKTFGEQTEEVKVLNGIDIDIYKGEFVSIMGASGSGKSTLMYALSGMDTMNGGTVDFQGQRLNDMTEEALANLRRTQMGFIFQQPTLLKNLSILDNIVLPMLRDKSNQPKEVFSRAERLMEKVGIEELADRRITQVSGGQLQRAGICRALVGQPEILFGDEPTGALNSKAAQEIMNSLIRINREGTTILIVTHDAKVAAQSERVLFMEDGLITDELFLGKYMERELEQRIGQVSAKMLETEV